MLKIQQVKTKDTQHSQMRKVSIFDESYELNFTITYELSSWYYRLIIKWERNKKRLWVDWLSEFKYDKKIYHMGKYEIAKNFVVENFYKNEKNVATYYTIAWFLDKFIEDLKNYEEKNS